MNCSRQEFDSLYEDVHRAFAPDSWPLMSLSSYCRPNMDEESEAALQAAYRDWRDVAALPEPFPLQWTIPLLPRRLFVYLIPAFMAQSLKVAGGLWLTVMNQIAPPWGPRRSPDFCEGMAAIDAQQRLCVVRFLEIIEHNVELKANVLRRMKVISGHLRGTGL